jgi:hypothetical protein
MGYVDGVQMGPFIKVGAAADLKARMHQFRLYNPYPCKIILRRTVTEYFWLEKRMHELLDGCAIGREWFECSAQKVKDAYEVAYADLVARRHNQTVWEAQCVKRAAQRAVARAAKLGTEWGKATRK